MLDPFVFVTTSKIRIVTMRKFVTIVALSLSLASGAALAQQGATGETGSPGNANDPTGTAPPQSKMGNGTQQDVNTKDMPSGYQTQGTGGGTAESGAKARAQGAPSKGTTNGSNNR
jgi:hypothetical protein